MKKIFIFVVCIFLNFEISKADLIELEDCYVVYKDKPGYDLEWSEEFYYKDNLMADIPKDFFFKTYEKFGIKRLHKGKDIYKEKYFKELPDLNYVTIGRPYDQGEEYVELIKSAKGKLYKRYDRSIVSINPESNFVTLLNTKSDDYHRSVKDEYLRKGKMWKFMYQKTSTHKYYIDSYAAGIIIAYAYYDFYDSPSDVKRENPLEIDLNKNTVTKTFDDSQSPTRRVCRGMSSSSNSQEVNASSGTAFFIDKDGNLLTNNHVVDGCKSLSINYNNKEYDAQLIATDKTLDLALLKVNVRPKSFINFSNYNPKKLQKIYVAGYPFGKGLSDDLKISSGIISSLKGVQDNSNELQIDAAINHGNSGGPIVGEGGELIAIAVSGLGKEMSEGINFGIKSSAALNFLGANDIDPSRSNRSKLNSDKLLEILEESTTYISCTY